MHVCATVAEFRRWRVGFQGTVGFVPTMGALHDGHLELVRSAVNENDAAVASIFVNAGQFAPGEDLDRYPRQFERDAELLRSLGVQAIFAPAVDELYPFAAPGAVGFKELLATHVVPAAHDARAEGAVRPGFFTGVATVVCKLFNIVSPSRAYFGQKDGQQCIVLRRMVLDFNFPLDLVVLPTVREADGLAMSSRNVYLTESERAAAPKLHVALRAVEESYRAGERERKALLAPGHAILEAESAFDVEYLSLNDAFTMEPCGDTLQQHGPVMVSAAVNFGSTRILDNAFLPSLLDAFSVRGPR